MIFPENINWKSDPSCLERAFTTTDLPYVGDKVTLTEEGLECQYDGYYDSDNNDYLTEERYKSWFTALPTRKLPRMVAWYSNSFDSLRKALQSSELFI